MHIAALVLGILSLIGGGCCTGIPAIICGHIGKNSAENESDRSLANVGMILGYISVFLTLAVFIIYILFFGGMIALGIATEGQ